MSDQSMSSGVNSLPKTKSKKLKLFKELGIIEEQHLSSYGNSDRPQLLSTNNYINNRKRGFGRIVYAGKDTSGPIMEVKVAPETSNSTNRIIDVSWNNLTYTVKRQNSGFISTKSEGKYKNILNAVSGSFRSGEMTAIMGPSGAGKSTLLECVCGKRSKGLIGNIYISGTDTIKVGFVEQFDHLLEQLTVKESLLFASRLRNANRKNINHETIAINLIHKLGLEVCSQTPAYGCSGGQRKRLSIALELVSKANILILDEPTSGLDSSATSQTVEAMLSLTKQKKPMAVVATIHQPSATIFNMFHNVIVMSNGGNCIFQGPPSQVIPTLSLVGLTIPNFYNPADYILEVASGEFGKQSLHLLTHYNKEFNRNKSSNMSDIDRRPLKQAIKKDKSDDSRPILKHIFILFIRTFLTTMREPQLSLLRVFTIFPTAFLIGLLFSENVGKASGCPPSKLMLWKLNINSLISKFDEERHLLQENVSLMFLTVMMSMFVSLSPTILTFPLEMNVFRKEYRNSYYSVFAYYVAKVLSDLPFCFLTSMLFTTIIYFMTGQIFDSWSRFLYLIAVNLLVTLSGQSIGMVFGAIFMENPNAATFASGIVVLPLFIFAGFFKKLSLLPAYLLPFSYVSFLRYALSAVLITIFGVGRCTYEHTLAEAELDLTNLTRPQWLNSLSIVFDYQSFLKPEEEQIEREPEENLLILFGGKNSVVNNTQKSLLLVQFEIQEDEESLWDELRLLMIFVGVMHCIIYFTLVWKVAKKS